VKKWIFAGVAEFFAILVCEDKAPSADFDPLLDRSSLSPFPSHPETGFCLCVEGHIIPMATMTVRAIRGGTHWESRAVGFRNRFFWGFAWQYWNVSKH